MSPSLPIDDHEANTELLGAELPDPRFCDTSYLRWLYDQNPLGPAVRANGDEGGRRMAHYALIPQDYRCAAGRARLMFSLNAVTRSGGQRRGWFTQLGHQVYDEAAAEGALGVIGVSNENSTPPVVRKLGWRLMGPLPVRIVVPAGRRRPTTEHHVVDAATLATPLLTQLADDAGRTPAEGWTQAWTAETLRWRLSAPNMASRYWLHVADDLVAVTARTTLAGMRVAVMLKLIDRTGDRCRTGAPTDAKRVITDACWFHRAPVAVYAGYNRRVRVSGPTPPRRLLPAPLNLIYRSLSPAAPQETFTLDCFEFLDMDAY